MKFSFPTNLCAFAFKYSFTQAVGQFGCFLILNFGFVLFGLLLRISFINNEFHDI